MVKCWCGICDLVDDCIAGGLPEKCYVNRLIGDNQELIDLIERNQLAWNHSKDKIQGLLPEVYLANQYMLRIQKGG